MTYGSGSSHASAPSSNSSRRFPACAGLIGCALAMALTGCSMIETESLYGSMEPVREGAVTYSLPMTVLRLKVIQYDGPKGPVYDIAEFKEGDVCRRKVGETDQCSEVLTIPDPEHTYVVRFRGSILSDDKLTLTLGKEGYLSGVDADATDRTGAILVKGVEIATRTSGISLSDANRSNPKVVVASIIVDPHRDNSLADANRQLREYGLSISCGGVCGPPAATAAGEREEVYFRQKATILLRVASKTGHESVYPLQSFNGSPLIAQRVDRGPFIQRKTTLSYGKDGEVASAVYNKKSEALGFVNTAGNIVATVVNAPVAVLTQDTQEMAKEEEYLKARESLFEQQKKTLDAEKAARKN